MWHIQFLPLNFCLCKPKGLCIKSISWAKNVEGIFLSISYSTSMPNSVSFFFKIYLFWPLPSSHHYYQAIINSHPNSCIIHIEFCRRGLKMKIRSHHCPVSMLLFTSYPTWACLLLLSSPCPSPATIALMFLYCC